MAPVHMPSFLRTVGATGEKCSAPLMELILVLETLAHEARSGAISIATAGHALPLPHPPGYTAVGRRREGLS